MNEWRESEWKCRERKEFVREWWRRVKERVSEWKSERESKWRKEKVGCVIMMRMTTTGDPNTRVIWFLMRSKGPNCSFQERERERERRVQEWMEQKWKRKGRERREKVLKRENVLSLSLLINLTLDSMHEHKLKLGNWMHDSSFLFFLSFFLFLFPSWEHLTRGEIGGRKRMEQRETCSVKTEGRKRRKRDVSEMSYSQTKFWSRLNFLSFPSSFMISLFLSSFFLSWSLSPSTLPCLSWAQYDSLLSPQFYIWMEKYSPLFASSVFTTRFVWREVKERKGDGKSLNVKLVFIDCERESGIYFLPLLSSNDYTSHEKQVSFLVHHPHQITRKGSGFVEQFLTRTFTPSHSFSSSLSSPTAIDINVVLKLTYHSLTNDAKLRQRTEEEKFGGKKKRKKSSKKEEMEQKFEEENGRKISSGCKSVEFKTNAFSKVDVKLIGWNKKRKKERKWDEKKETVKDKREGGQLRLTLILQFESLLSLPFLHETCVCRKERRKV